MFHRRIRNQRRIAAGEDMTGSHANPASMHHAMHDHLAIEQVSDDLAGVIPCPLDQLYPDSGPGGRP